MKQASKDALGFIRKQFASGKSLGRAYMNVDMRELPVSQPILDIGAGQVGSASYHNLIPHFHALEVYSVDIFAEKHPTTVANIEQGLPFNDEFFRTCLAFNVFEHLYEFKDVLHEIWRVLAPASVLYLSVPFLARVHADPNDYFRYTHSTLKRSLAAAGFDEIVVKPYGAGAMTAALSQIDFLIPKIFRRFILQIALLLDRQITKRSGGKYRNANDYPLGYFITARKSEQPLIASGDTT